MITCPCTSQKNFSNCCEPYLNGSQHPETPEKLMRSRYAAYSLAKIDYIQKTMRQKAAENYDADAAFKWASSIKWLGLTVIDAPTPKNNISTVTFFARFSAENKKQFIYEKSNFEKINNEWFYVDGITLKINRNDDCPCGSEKNE